MLHGTNADRRAVVVAALVGQSIAGIALSSTVALAQMRGIDAPLARVVGVEGQVHVVGTAGADRVLAIGGRVNDGERIETRAGARVGLMTEGAYVGLGADSSLRISESASGALRLEVDRGVLRLLDTRDVAPPRIESPGLRISKPALDTQLEVLSAVDGDGETSRVCARTGSLQVGGEAGDEDIRVAEGSCAIPLAGGGVTISAATVAPLPLLMTQAQGEDGVAPRSLAARPAVGMAADRFTNPTDVSAARFGDPADVASGGGFAPLGFADRPGLAQGNRSGNLLVACDTPATVCGLGPASARSTTGPPGGAPTGPFIPGTRPGQGGAPTGPFIPGTRRDASGSSE